MIIQKILRGDSIGKLLEYFKELDSRGKHIDDNDEYYLLLALAVATRSGCLRRKYGCVIVKDNKIISTGYNIAPSACIATDKCYREIHNIPHGEQYGKSCQAVHAEQNALIHADGRDLANSTMYLMGFDCTKKELITASPCEICKPMLKNAEVKRVISVFTKNDLFFPITVFEN